MFSTLSLVGCTLPESRATVSDSIMLVRCLTNCHSGSEVFNGYIYLMLLGTRVHSKSVYTRSPFLSEYSVRAAFTKWSAIYLGSCGHKMSFERRLIVCRSFIQYAYGTPAMQPAHQFCVAQCLVEKHMQGSPQPCGAHRRIDFFQDFFWKSRCSISDSGIWFWLQTASYMYKLYAEYYMYRHFVNCPHLTEFLEKKLVCLLHNIHCI